MNHFFFNVPLSHTFQDHVDTSGFYTQSFGKTLSYLINQAYSCSGTKTHKHSHTFSLNQSLSFSQQFSWRFFSVFYKFWVAFNKFLSHVGQFLCSYPMETNVIGTSIYMYIYTKWTFSLSTISLWRIKHHYVSFLR